MSHLLAPVVRLLAFVGKELIETIRRPGALVSLVFGPFLIMALFGFGFDGVRRPLDTIVVLPSGSGIAADAEEVRSLAGAEVNVLDVTPDEAAAMDRLAAGTADAVILAPEDTQARFRAGRQSVIEVRINAVDPVAAGFAYVFADTLSNRVNAEIIRRAVAEGQELLGPEQPDAARIPPEVAAAPTRAEVSNVSPSRPTVVGFYGPALVALVLQHIAIALAALSLVRDRMSGMLEVLRVAPVSAFEVIAGKVAAFLVLGGGFAALLTFGLVGVFGVPILDASGSLPGTLVLLLLASIGVGLMIAVFSDSERQAVQLSLLFLLASVFLSGFVVGIDQFTAPVRTIAYLLPVTHGIGLVQDLMLRGATNNAWQWGALGAIAVATIGIAWLRLRVLMSRG
ncbi:MAG: ABC transporter permease [Chloroflexota bacterium]